MSKVRREQIIDEATALMSSGGEEAVSMRTLAARLGVTPMALYHHFADRDALLVAIVEQVSQSIVLPELSGSPEERSVVLALCLHDFLVDHPWMIRLISTGRLASPAGMAFPEGFLACARDAGLDDDDSFVFYRTMFSAVLGQATVSHAKHGGTATLPNHADALTLPIVAGMAERWAELDAAAHPRRIFEEISGILQTS